MNVHVLPPQGEVWPEREWAGVCPAKVGLDAARLEQAASYAGGAGMVVYRGQVAFTWGDIRERHHIQSATKSIGITALGLALAESRMRLEDLAHLHHPSLGVPPEENRTTGWLEEIRLTHLAAMTAGFGKDGGYTNLLFAPGTKWAYSDGGVNWLGECLTLAFREDLDTLLFRRVFDVIGITRDDLTWRDNIFRSDQIEGIKRREIGAGIFASADAMARIGLLYLREGRWQDKSILPRNFVESIRRVPPTVAGLPIANDPQERFGGASQHYGLLWWNNTDKAVADAPVDTYWAWGLGDSLIVVIPSLDLVVSRVGSAWLGDRKPSYYRLLTPFFAPIATAVK
jgi:CubicO group peptidase (beta-lactamase class C family)